ncbi:hypothetical protein MPH_02150 [Macrophomina phaseolina MS6]|uniref:Uncharacterized protein n=1 Tax=Macrophomina phaseolina (strain MS6) TaxID=1126212 RepID=K2S0X6_MACPH|nr:hypothetical protein MPH_02150 [Macrophomina phaseolina MS6]
MDGKIRRWLGERYRNLVGPLQWLMTPQRAGGSGPRLPSMLGLLSQTPTKRPPSWPPSPRPAFIGTYVKIQQHHRSACYSRPSQERRNRSHCANLLAGPARLEFSGSLAPRSPQFSRPVEALIPPLPSLLPSAFDIIQSYPSVILSWLLRI